jgi:hypothetical protein
MLLRNIDRLVTRSGLQYIVRSPHSCEVLVSGVRVDPLGGTGWSGHCSYGVASHCRHFGSSETWSD